MKKILLLLTMVVMVVTSYGNSFENVIAHTFKYEGSGLDLSSNHSRYGVSKETIQKYNKKYKTSYTVKSLTKTQATKIAKKLYYDNFNIGIIDNDKLAIAVFDFIYNSNPSNAAKRIEKAAQTFGLKVKVDGVLTKEELKRMNTVNANDLANQICKNRLSYMQGLKVWKTYKNGWTKRVNSIKSLKG
jgi:lysozyme family protein